MRRRHGDNKFNSIQICLYHAFYNKIVSRCLREIKSLKKEIKNNTSSRLKPESETASLVLAFRGEPGGAKAEHQRNIHSFIYLRWILQNSAEGIGVIANKSEAAENMLVMKYLQLNSSFESRYQRSSWSPEDSRHHQPSSQLQRSFTPS